jgi:soluble lytic murein transglycosylase-like protein
MNRPPAQRRPVAGTMEHLIDQIDVYALSPHAEMLALPRMVSPLFVMEARQGRMRLPTPHQWAEIIEHGSRQSGLDAALIAAVIAEESGYAATAVSPKGAQGLMQLMPATQVDMGVTDPFDPQANVDAGSAYLRTQLDTFGTLELALAAYNAGPGNVRRYRGIPPFPETRAFVRRVLERYQPTPDALSD